MIDPQLGKQKLEMAQTAPGRYQAEFDTPQPGSYQLMFTQNAGRPGRSASSRAGWPSATPTSSGSGRPTPSCLRVDRRGDRAAGSTRSPSGLRRPGGRAPRATPLWPYLLAAAALLFVLDVALRRIDLTLLGRRRRRILAFAASRLDRTIVVDDRRRRARYRLLSLITRERRP